MAKPFRFGKKEKLKSRKAIDTLFSNGKSFAQPPLRIIYRLEGGKGAARVGVTASKRYFKKAVDRNRIKRLIREAYRLGKEAWLPALEARALDADVFFMFNGRELPRFEEISESMNRSLNRLEKIVLAHEIPL